MAAVANPAQSAFIAAIEAGNTEEVRQLINTGRVDINPRERRHDTHPLFIASDRGHLGIVRLLLHVGAEVNVRVTTDTGDEVTEDDFLSSWWCRLLQDQTPLMAAAAAGSHHVTKLLITHKANVNEQSGKRRRTALHMAAQEAWPEVIRVLITRGADPNITDSEGRTPLHWTEHYGDLDSSQLLLEHHAAAMPDSYGVVAGNLLQDYRGPPPRSYSSQPPPLIPLDASDLEASTEVDSSTNPSQPEPEPKRRRPDEMQEMLARLRAERDAARRRLEEIDQRIAVAETELRTSQASSVDMDVNWGEFFNVGGSFAMHLHGPPAPRDEEEVEDAATIQAPSSGEATITYGTQYRAPPSPPRRRASSAARSAVVAARPEIRCGVCGVMVEGENWEEHWADHEDES